MDFQIKPEENEFRKARETVENELKSLENSIEVDDFEVILGWQDFGRETTFQVTEEGIALILDSNYGWEGEIRTSLVRGLLELEFMEKSAYDEISFHWQDIAMMSYVKARSIDLLEEERQEPDIDVDTSRIISELSRDSSDFSKLLYENAGKIASLIGRKTRKEEKIERIPEMNQEEITNLVREVV